MVTFMLLDLVKCRPQSYGSPYKLEIATLEAKTGNEEGLLQALARLRMYIIHTERITAQAQYFAVVW